MMVESERPNPDGVSKEFDPRFSRAFQPGFDPRVHREAPPSAMLREDPRADRGVDRGIDRDSVGGGFTGVRETSMFAVPESSGAAPGDPTERRVALDEAEGDEADLTAWWRRVNPWFIVLWVLGIGFIAASIAIVAFSVEWQNAAFQGTEGGQSYFILLQLMFQGAPLLAVLGIATLTSTVVIQAAR